MTKRSCDVNLDKVPEALRYTQFATPDWGTRMDAPARFDVFVVDRSVLVAGVRSIDSHSAEQFGDCLGPLQGHVTIDLTGVTSLDASAIGVLLRHRLRLARCDGRLSLVGPGVVVRRTLRSAGLAGWIVDHASCPDDRQSGHP